MANSTIQMTIDIFGKRMNRPEESGKNELWVNDKSLKTVCNCKNLNYRKVNSRFMKTINRHPSQDGIFRLSNQHVKASLQKYQLLDKFFGKIKVAQVRSK